MKIVLLFLLFSFPLLAQDKIAIIVGDDFKGDTHMEGLGVRTAKALNKKGYKTLNLYGNEKRASEIANEHSVDTKPFTLNNLKNELDKIYQSDCSSRPAQLMLNLVTHGSYNGGNHILNTRDEIGPTPVRSIASHIKKIKGNDPGCDRPKLAIIDTSCKSGGSIKEFKGLGCVLTTTSTYNQTSLGFTEELIKKISGNQKINNLSDLHMDLLLNRDYELLEREYVDGKTIMKRLFDNSNQIAGCYEEDEGDFNVGLNNKLKLPFSATCEDPVSVLSLRREKEISEIERIIKNLNFSKELDKNQIAKIWNKDLSKFPGPLEIKNKINELVEEDKSKNTIMEQILQKEKELLSHPDLDKSAVCRLQVPSGTNRADANKLNNIFSKNTSPFAEQKEAIAKTLCHVHSTPDNFGDCAKYASRGALNISFGELFKLKKDFDYLLNNFREIEANKAIAENRRLKNIDVNVPALLKTYQKVINSCFEQSKNSDNSNIANAAKFIEKQYGINKSDCQDELICHIEKANLREQKLKNYFALARAYYYLQCKEKFDASSDLKACEDYSL